MPSRPRIPAEMVRKLLQECGFRCAVCGEATPLDKAHIIPWNKTHRHRHDDLLCLCANCHRRADTEGWGVSVLRDYKERPWVLRRYEGPGSSSEEKLQLVLEVEIEVSVLSRRYLDDLRQTVAEELGIDPEAVRVASVH